MRSTARRLTSLKAIIAYIIVILVVLNNTVGAVANIDFVLTAQGNSRLVSLWNFFATPKGNLVAVILAALWITALVLWPQSNGAAVTTAKVPSNKEPDKEEENPTQTASTQQPIEKDPTQARQQVKGATRPNLILKRKRVSKNKEGDVIADAYGLLAKALLEFKNDPDAPFPVVTATVRASISFEEIGGEHMQHVSDGHWLKVSERCAKFRPGDVKTLFIAGQTDRDVRTITVLEEGHRLNTYFERIPADLPDQEYKVEVQLFAESPTRFLGKHQFKLITRPELKIEEIDSIEGQTAHAAASESRSKLDILFDSGYPYEYYNGSSGISEIRIGVKNNGLKEIPRVKVQIDEIRIAGDVYKSLPLCMAREPHYLEFPLAPEETEFVSIAFSIADNKHAALYQRSGDNINNWLREGTYKFTISAIGTDTKPCRKHAVLDVDAEGHIIFRLVSD